MPHFDKFKFLISKFKDGIGKYSLLTIGIMENKLHFPRIFGPSIGTSDLS